MFIDYNELKEFVSCLLKNYKEQDKISFIDNFNKFSKIDKLLSVVEISCQKREYDYLYKVSFSNYEIGNITSNFLYDTDKNKLRFINDLVRNNENCMLTILKAILNYNIKVLENNLDTQVNFVTDVVSKDNKKNYLSDDFYSTEGYVYHSIYGDNTFIGMDMIESVGYKSEAKLDAKDDVFGKDNQVVDIDMKKYLLKSMERYNLEYFDKYLGDYKDTKKIR